VPTLQVLRRIVDSENTDAHGNPITTYADPVDWEVDGLAPGASVENSVDNRDLSIVVWTVYAQPSANAPSDLDLVMVGDDTFAVNAHRADWTQGPWMHPTAGDVVQLKRPEG
jgi:hypothetical protein